MVNIAKYQPPKGTDRQVLGPAYRNPSITVKELRVITDTVNDYERFQSLETWILKKPLEEINAHTSFNVTYEKIKAGRSIDSIQFHIEKKRRADDNSYKLEDTAYQEDKARKAETEDKLAIEAMKRKYTTLLLENMLLSPFEMQDTKIMAGLQVHVYPLYDELKELRGLNGVKDHLSYVASRREEYSKHNIARYLKKAIEQYLPTVKRQDLNHE